MRRPIPAINAATSGSMNNRRSYLDSINAGRRRRASTSLEEISSTLDEIESRIRSPHDERLTSRRDHRLAGEASFFGERDRWAHTRDDRAPRAAGFDSVGVAQELSALRRDLRDQMGAGLRREFAALKSEIETAMQTSGPAGQVAELGVEFERLSAMIHKLASQSDDRQVNLLRLEMEQVKNALGKLAREDTVQSFDRRWDEFDQRWTDIANQVSSVQRDPALQALSARLEQIGDAVNALPTSVALRSLEEKMKLLAATVDQFAHHQDRIGPDALDAIEERLDEISRAVAASTSVAHPVAFDPEPFQRIEARISGLTRQMEEAAQTNPAAALADQLSALSHRVEDISHRVDLPEHVIEKLSDRIDSISYKLDQAPGRPDLDEVFHNLENRFASLSALLEQRHDDALAKGQNLFRDLERRLDSVAISVESGSRAPSAQDTRLMEAMEARFADLATRLDRQPAAPADEAAIRALEARIDTMSSKIEASVLQPGIDKKLIRSLETQIADLAAHLSRPAEPVAAAEDIRPRLDKIEEAVAAGRQDVLEAAREAAEEAVRRFAGSGSGPDGALVAGLADDLKSLEALTRKSDDRNAKTFEAIHDTLLKIVSRLGAIENGDTGPQKQAAIQVRETLLGAMQTPSLQPSAEAMPFAGVDDDAMPAGDDALTPKKGYRTAAAAAAEAAADAIRSDAAGAGAAAGGRRSMFSGLTRALSGRKGRKGSQVPEALAGDPQTDTTMEAETPAVELDAPLDPVMANQPLEPGTGAPDLNAIMKRVRDERGEPARGKASVETAKADFIAAARRAAQAAAAEAEIMKRSPAAKTKSGGFSLGGLLKSRRKPVLMGVAAILMALAGLQIGKSFLGNSAGEVAQAPAPATAAIVAEAVAIEDAKPLPAQPVRVATEAPAPSSARAAIAAAPQRAEDVSTTWLDVDKTASPPQAPAATAQVPEVEDAAELQTPPEPTEEQIAAIPLEAGPVALREAAAAGDPKALFEIGNRYANGRGVPEDMAVAAQWYEQAADEGLAPAQYRIGNLYEKGIGVERDVAAAKTWYQLAAAQGNASAMHNLAVLFAMGADGTTDNESAARWFGEAAERGVKDSQFNLGILAAKGVGMEQDLEEAYQWFALLAKAGDKDAAEKRDEVAIALSPEKLENARAAVELWRAKPVDPEANTVEVPDSWSEGEDVTASVDMKQAVRNIQQILNKNGYQAGPADGVMGAKTRSAIAAFQKDIGMAATGEVDEPLVHALLERR